MMHTPVTAGPTRAGTDRSYRVGVITLGALAAFGLLVTAAPATGEPLTESTIKSECQQANGDYTTYTEGGHRKSTCCYNDRLGNRYCDCYTDGEYQFTTPREVAPPPSSSNPPLRPPGPSQIPQMSPQ
jgi:hypothetical protein